MIKKFRFIFVMKKRIDQTTKKILEMWIYEYVAGLQEQKLTDR